MGTETDKPKAVRERIQGFERGRNIRVFKMRPTPTVYEGICATAVRDNQIQDEVLVWLYGWQNILLKKLIFA